MADVKISALAAATVLDGTEVLPVVQTSTKKAAVALVLQAAGNGSAAAPSFSFASDLDTGVYRIAANELGIATGGTLRATVNSTGVTVAGSLVTGSGGIVGQVYTSEVPTGTTVAGYGNLGDTTVAVGYNAALNNPATGDGLTAIGRDAGASLVTPSTYNTMVGHATGFGAANHAQSTIVGGLAGYNADLGSAGSLTAVGYAAGYQSSGVDCVFVGAQAGYANSVLQSVGVGTNALNANTGVASTAVGDAAGQGNTGGYLTAVGYLAGNSMTNEGSSNVVVGYAAAYQADYLQNSTLVGGGAGQSADMGASLANMTAVGYRAGHSNLGRYSVLLGAEAGQSNPATGEYLVAVGDLAGRSLVTPGSYNVMLGYATGEAAANHTNSTIVGSLAGYNADLGSAGSITAFGYGAGYTSTGISATLVGVNAGSGNTGTSVTAIGHSTGGGNTYDSVVLLGRGAVAAAANEMVIGSASYAANRWIPGHDPDTYFDWATADTLKVYAGGQKALEINETGGAPYLGFFGTAAVAKPTGVAVDAAGIHAALVTLGLISA